MTWADADGDGDPDLYISRGQGQLNSLLRNEGGDLFTVWWEAVSRSSFGVAWGDYDNDGYLDLYVANSYTLNHNSANMLWRNEGGISFDDETNGSPLNDADEGKGVSWIDYDGDGLLDLYFANYESPNKLLRNEGTGFFTDVTSGAEGHAGRGLGMAWGDYDNDGDQDLYLANHGEPNKLLRNDGDGLFTDVTTDPLGGGTRASFAAAWADYYNDGDMDIYVGNAGSSNALLRNDGGGLFTNMTSPDLLFDAGRRMTWGDYDNDGDLDLFVVSFYDGNKLFENIGGSFVDATVEPLADIENRGQSAAWADYDGDGDLDLFVLNFSDDSRLFRNDLDNGNHWLHLDLVGTVSNRSAIGARVRIVANGESQIREIGTDSGNLSQNSLTVEFGLGAVALVDSVIIRWPSGMVQDTTGVAVDQRLTVVEYSTTSGHDGVDSSLDQFMLHGSMPNPFNPMTEVEFSLPKETEVSLSVFDAVGRRIVDLVAGARMAPGRHSVEWAGTDSQGDPVPPGVYFCRFESSEHVESLKMILLK